jgi:hypothetical protein
MSKRQEISDDDLDQVAAGWPSEFQAFPDLDANASFKGSTPSEAFFVKVDAETTTQSDSGTGSTSTVRAVQILK